MNNSNVSKATFKLLLVFLAFTFIISCSSQKPMIGAVDAEALSTALQAGDRTAAEKERDIDRKPSEVIAFLGIKPGMSVMDLVAAGGYYTEVLSYAVGSEGKVYAQNPDFVLKFRDGVNDKAMTARLKDGRLTNVTRLDREIGDTNIAANSLDAAFTALNLHDIYNRSPEAAVATLEAVRVILKPGGVLGIVDHNGNPGADNAQLHRMEMATAISVARQAGFTVETSELLANKDDDRTRMVFAPGLRGKTDRFLLKLTKP